MSALYSPWTVYRDNVSFMSLYRVTRVKRYVKNGIPRPSSLYRSRETECETERVEAARALASR